MRTALSAAPARRLPLYGLLGAILISTTGNAVTQLAIPWYVLATTGSPAKTGLAAFFGTLPLVLGAFFGGAVVDRLGFKRSSVFADVVSGVSVAAIPLLHSTIGLPFWALLALVFSAALFDTSGVAARTALLVDLAKTARLSLERVNSLEELALNIPLLLGPPVGGLLIASMDPSQVLWVDAASFAFSAVAISLLVTGSDRRRDTTRKNYRRELIEGLGFIARDRVLLWLIVFTALVNLLLAPLPRVLLPVYMERIYGSAVGLGMLIAAFGIGLLIGVVLYGTVAERWPRRPLLAVGMLGLSLTALVLSLSPPFWMLATVAVVGGAAYGPFNPLVTTVAGERTPEAMRGRIFGTLSAIATAAAPLGVL